MAHVFFFKQNTAYEMLRSLVGSEMCIRDRFSVRTATPSARSKRTLSPVMSEADVEAAVHTQMPVSYTHLTLPTIYSV